MMNIIGDVRGKTAVIIDDEIDTAGSLMEAVGALENAGTKGIYSCATHGVFSGAALERIAASPLTEIIVTDTVPLPPEASHKPLDSSFPPRFPHTPLSLIPPSPHTADALGRAGAPRHPRCPRALAAQKTHLCF